MEFKLIYNQQTNLVTDIITVIDTQLIEPFLKYAMNLPDCAGLAANQVSCDGFRFMMRMFAINFHSGWNVCINPEILEYVGQPEEKFEGCKTWINRTIVADRYNEIVVSYFDYVNNQTLQRRLTGFDAQVFQHEMNHLNGINEKFNEVHLFDTLKHGRNDPCICGSGIKYKKCCLTPKII